MTGDSILDKLAPVSTDEDCLLEITKLFIEGEHSKFSYNKNRIHQLPSAILFSENLEKLENNIVLKQENLNTLFTEICSLIGVSSIDQNKFLDS